MKVGFTALHHNNARKVASWQWTFFFFFFHPLLLFVVKGTGCMHVKKYIIDLNSTSTSSYAAVCIRWASEASSLLWP